METERSHTAASEWPLGVAVNKNDECNFEPIGKFSIKVKCLDTESLLKERCCMQKITPFLWFDNQAEEAANFYVSLFKNSYVGGVRRYGDAGPGPKGSVMSVDFQLEGQDFIALNGGRSSSLRRQFLCS
jgi:3-demethylubiquinone-9 3-methyltransferase